MSKVLTTSSNVTCGHSGTVQVASTAKLRVGGKPVLIKSSVKGKPVSGCKTQTTNDPSGTPLSAPCQNVTTVSAGEAKKLLVGGQPVLLDSLGGVTNGLVEKQPPKALAAEAGQQKLSTV